MILQFYRSTIGKKVVVALTGLILIGFVLGHMAGNLKAFFGADSNGVYKLDSYAHYLRVMGEHFFGYAGLLWIVRIVLLVSLVVHVVTVIQLTLLNKRSRATSYAVVKSGSATVASRTMFVGGLLLLVFVVYHIFHMTLGKLHVPGFVEGRVYANVYSAFQQWYVLVIYLMAMTLLGLHLFHGTWSLFQTLGLDNPDRNKALRCVAMVVSVVVVVGFIAVPLAAFFHLIPAPTGQVEAVQVAILQQVYP